jgi:hypothetical protein
VTTVALDLVRLICTVLAAKLLALQSNLTATTIESDVPIIVCHLPASTPHRVTLVGTIVTVLSTPKGHSSLSAIDDSEALPLIDCADSTRHPSSTSVTTVLAGPTTLESVDGANL